MLNAFPEKIVASTSTPPADYSFEIRTPSYQRNMPWLFIAMVPN